MPHLGDIPEEAEAREFGVDNAVDDATLPEFAEFDQNFTISAEIYKSRGCQQGSERVWWTLT